MGFYVFLLLPLVGALLSLLFYRVESVKKSVAFIIFIAIFYFNIKLIGQVGYTYKIPFEIWGIRPGFSVTYLGLFFSLMISGITVLTVLFSLRYMVNKENSRMYYFWLFLKTFGMLGVVLSGDFLMFFIMWEMMSWSTFFLMAQSGGKAYESSYRYLVYAVVSAMMLMFGIMLMYSYAGSFEYDIIHKSLASINKGMLVLISILLITSFSIEAAVYPVHKWLPKAYSNTFTTLTSYLAGISTRMGVYGIIFYMFNILGMPLLDKMHIIGAINFRYVFAWFAAFTIVIPTFTALLQNDGKELMTWHGIGQGGYMLVGIASGTSLGIAGGMFHVLNHMTYITLILFSLAAVEYRTGTTNLNKLGGLIKKQPVAFLGVLLGIIGLAGIPPMNGFVSKWFIYKALISSQYPFLATAAFVGTLGTILSVYKFIHNIFLGQLPERYNNVREVPFDMQLPIWILMLAVFGLGVYPGLAVSFIAKVQDSLGIAPVSYTLHGVMQTVGNLNMGIVAIVFMSSMFVGFIVYLLGNRRKHVSQYDNYAAGNFLDSSVPYNYNYHFYAGFEHIIKPAYDYEPVQRTEDGIIRFTTEIADYFRRLYTGNINTYGMYILIGLLITILILL